MSIFKTIINFIFFTNSTVFRLRNGKFGTYKKNNNFRIRGHFENYQIDLSKQRPKVIPEVYDNRYRADNITVILPTSEKWQLLEPNMSVKNIEQTWNEFGRTLIGQTPTYSFQSFYIHYNDMDLKALKVHCADINQFLNIKQSIIDAWFADLGVYNKNKTFEENLTIKNYRVCWKMSGGDNPNRIDYDGIPLYTVILYFDKI